MGERNINGVGRIYALIDKSDGPLVSLKMGTQTMILCGSDEVVKELMEKRSATSSIKVDMFIRTFGDNLNIAFRE